MNNSSNLSATEIKRDLTAYAKSLGFERMGVTSSEALLRDEEFLKQWLAGGNAGEMTYLERGSERRSRPEELLPGARTVISMTMNYYSDDPSFEWGIARYARGTDYHKVLTKRLESFVRYLQAFSPESECRTFVDTGPLLERAFAQQAGLGFIGKNTMLISKGIGSWVFLASVITSLDIPLDAPDDRSCGDCRLCIDACPTQAITEPYKLDPRLCIAYLTIESDNSIPEALRPKLGGWVFGCDICQEVCPHNARPAVDTVPALKPGDHSRVGLAEILSIQNEESFQKRFGGTPLTRAGREGLLRNACVAAGNLGRRDLIPLLQSLSRQDSHAIVREHAAWALQQLC